VHSIRVFAKTCPLSCIADINIYRMVNIIRNYISSYKTNVKLLVLPYFDYYFCQAISN